MKEIIFTGNPNAGKSTLLNALTGAHLHTGNWQGVTVGAQSITVKNKNHAFVYTDLPGVYALSGYSMEEKLAVNYIKTHKTALFVNVVDVRFLARSLLFTKELLTFGVRAVVVLTMCKSFYKNGGKIDINALAARLGVTVYTVDAFNKKDTSLLNDFLQSEVEKDALSTFKPKKPTSAYNFTQGEEILKGIFIPQNRKDSMIEKICYNRVLCLPLFFLLTAAVFFITFGQGMPGTVLKNILENFLCESCVNWVSAYLPTEAVRALVCDGFLRSAGGVLGFLPQIALLYSFLLFMEESGYMSALAFSADGVFCKLSLNGRAVFCVLLGFGCTAQAILSTRGFERKSMQRRTIAALPYISCSAKLPVYLTLLSSFFKHPFLPVVGLYLLGIIVSLTVFALQKGEERDGFIMELPQMQIPNAKFFLKTLLFRLKQFIIKIVTVVTAFTLVVWFLSSFNFSLQYVRVEESVLATLCGGLKYVFYPIGVYDWQATFALLSGLVAKENIAGLLNVFYPAGLTFSLQTAIALAVFVLFCSPCISAIAASAKEIGWGASVLNALLQTLTAVFAAYAVYYILKMPVWLFSLPLLLLLLFLFKRFCFERIHRPKRRQFKKLYR